MKLRQLLSRIGLAIALSQLVFFARMTLRAGDIVDNVTREAVARSNDRSESSFGPQLQTAGGNTSLVIAFGPLRGGDIAWRSLSEHVLDPNRADLAILCEEKDEVQSSMLFERAKYKWLIPVYEDWADAIDLIDGRKWRDAVLPRLYSKSALLGGVKGFDGDGAQRLMMKWFAAEYVKKNDLLQRYSRFVVTRADHLYLCRHDLSALEQEFLWLPEGSNNLGYPDGHLVTHSSNLLQALDLLPDVLSKPDNYDRMLRATGASVERLQMKRWNATGLSEKIRRFPRVQFPCDIQQSDPSTGDRVPEGVRRMSVEDYYLAHLSCDRDADVAVNPVTTTKAQQGSRQDSGEAKTLVVLLGNLRGGELAWKSLYENLLDVNGADLALMIGDTRAEFRNASLFQRATYHWTFPEFEDWGDALDQINGSAWREALIPLMHSTSPILGGVKAKGFWGSGAIIFVIRWYLSNKIRDLQLTHKYERFVITRSDHYYLCEHDLSELDPQYLWLPQGSDCGGFTDRHLVVSSQNVLSALNIIPPLLQHPERYQSIVQKRSGNPEKIIYKRWKEEHLKRLVRRFPRMLFTCGQDGDLTRWKEMGIRVKEGVRLKYADEYYESTVTCFNRQ